MKTITMFLSLFLWSILSTAQCLTGPTSLASGSSATYSIPSVAQCTSCYDWDIVSGDASFLTSDQNNSVTIRANSSGPFTIKVIYLSESGCQTYCEQIINSSPSSCCLPELNSYFNCGTWEQYGGHGAVYIAFPDCDSNTVSTIDWVLSNAEFVSGSLTGQSSGTTTGSGSPGNIGNYNCNSIEVQATVHYNNGCSSKVINETIIPLAGAPKKQATIYPNPAKSEINVNLGSLNNLSPNNNLEVKVIEINTGREVYSQKVKNNEKQELRIKGLESYNLLEVIIMNNGKVLNQKRVIVN